MSLGNPTVTAPLRPKYITDDYGTHEDTFGVGGLRTVQSVADLSAIQLKRRKSYMIVNVRNYLGSARPFWLASPDDNPTNLANNAYWIPVPFENWVVTGPSGGYIFKGKFNATTGLVTTGDYVGVALSDTPTPANVQPGWYWQIDTAGTEDFGGTVAVADEVLDTGDAVETNFTGALSNVPVNVGTVSITDGTQVITDDGSGNLIGDVDGGGTNTIDYKTGLFDVTFATAPPAVADNIIVDYSYGEHIFSIGDRAIWNGVEFDIDEQQNASNDWASIIGMPSIISDIGDGTFIPVSQTDFNTLEGEVNLNTEKLVTLVLGAGTDISAINNTDIITKQMLTNNYYNVTDIDIIEGDLITQIQALLNDSATPVENTVDSFISYEGLLISTYTSSKIEDRLLDVYNAAIADAPGGNVYANLGFKTGILDGITLTIDLEEKVDKIFPPIVDNIPQTLTTGYSIDNSGATTIITFSGTPSDFAGTNTKYEIHYLKGIGDALETDPIFTASQAFSITAANKSNWTEAYNNYIVSGSLSGTNLILSQRDGGQLAGIDLSSLSGGTGFTLNPLTNNYLSKSNLAGDNLTNSQIFDNGTDIGIFTSTVTDASFSVRKSVNTKSLVSLSNLNVAGTVLKLVVPTSGTGKLITGFNGATENFSVDANAKITANKLTLNNPANYLISSPKLLIYNEITKEVSTYNGTLGLDLILENNNSAPLRTGITKNWRFLDLNSTVGLVGHTNTGDLVKVIPNRGLTFYQNTLKLGGGFDEDISLSGDSGATFNILTDTGHFGMNNNSFNIAQTNTDGGSSGVSVTEESAGLYTNDFITTNTYNTQLLLFKDNIRVQSTHATFRGLNYYEDYSDQWTISTGSREIPDIGFIETNYFKNSGGAITGNVILDNLSGLSDQNRILLLTSTGQITNLTLGTNLSISGTTLNATGGDGGITTLVGLTDTTISSPTNIQYLGYNGSAWINRQIAYSQLSGTPVLATVATSNSYDDLDDKPTIPAGQVNSDWNSVSGLSQILNKPTLATVATSGNYNDLSSKPTIYTSLASLVDTSLATIASNHYLGYNGSAWVNRQIAYSQISGVPSLATVATSGNYNDLSNKPTIYSTLSSLTDTTISGLSTNHYLGWSGSSWINRQINYNELAGNPTLLTQTIGTWTPVVLGVSLVISSGSYIKTGNLVFITWNITMPSTTDTTDFEIENLPFPISPAGNGSGIFTFWNLNTTGLTTTYGASANNLKIRPNYSAFIGDLLENIDFSQNSITGHFIYRST